MTISCASCRYGKHLGMNRIECRRMPPSAEMGGTWPVIGVDQWCGEYSEGNVGDIPLTALDLHMQAEKKQEDTLPHKEIIKEEYLPRRKK